MNLISVLAGEPTREEVKQAYLELLINDKFDYELIITAKIKEQELTDQKVAEGDKYTNSP